MLLALKNNLGHWWNQLINIGVKPTTPEWYRKRIRIINGISVYAIIIFTAFTIGYAFGDFKATFYESLVATILYLITLAINKWGSFDFCRVFFVIFNALLFFYFAVAHGEADGAEYLLFSSSVGSMLFFRKFRSIAFIFAFNMTIFWLAKYLFNVIEPFAASEGANLYIENHVFTFLALFFVVFHFNSENQKKEEELEVQNKILAKEIEKSDRLLLNILPEEIANELKNSGKSNPRYFELVTVMFTDFKSFTLVSRDMNASDLVSDLNQYFTAFDQITKEYGIEKIKTIGDSYMCAFGLRTDDDPNKPAPLIRAAIKMQEYIKKIREENIRNHKSHFDMRIGIHSGPVVAGIVGQDKFAYDIWGDTVNIASRMESACEVDKINISTSCYELVKEDFNCKYRGKIKIKNMEEIDMYFIDSPEIAVVQPQ